MRIALILALALVSLGPNAPANADIIFETDRGGWESRIDRWFMSSYIRGGETVEPRGGSVLTGKVGPWYLSRYTFEDGAEACMAFNLVQRRLQPQFSYVRVRGDDGVREFVSFVANTAAGAARPAVVRIGGDTFDLMAASGDDPRVARTSSMSTARDIVETLGSRERATRKYFEVTDARGQVYRFDARDTAEMRDRLERSCS